MVLFSTNFFYYLDLTEEITVNNQGEFYHPHILLLFTLLFKR